MSKKNGEWARMTTFVDVDGRRVTEFEVIDGPKRGNKIYKGQIMLTVKVSPDPRVPPQQMPLEFEFSDDRNFKWVTEHFDEEANKAIEVWKKQQAEAQARMAKQLVQAKAMPMMLGPNGKPIKG